MNPLTSIRFRPAAVALFVAGLVLLACAGRGVAADDKPATPVDTSAKTGKGLQVQEYDDPALPLTPIKPRSADEQKRIDAVAWFAAGRVLETRNQFPNALRAYQEALKHDPRAVVVYRVIIPLAFGLNRTDDAVRWMLEAVKLDPNDYQLLRRLGTVLANQGNLTEAAQLLEQATKANGLKKDSPTYVTLMRDLGLLHKALNRSEAAADAFEIVFKALQNPDEYHLDFRTKADLLKEPAAVYERMGQIFLDANRTDLAIQAFEKAAGAKKSSSGNLSFNLAMVYLKANDPAKALDELQKYLDAQRSSKGRAAYDLLAEILRKLDKTAELLPRLEQLAEKDPKNATLQYYLADELLAAKRLDDAEKLYKKTLTLSADLPGFVGLASIYRQQQRPGDLLNALGKGYAETGELTGLSAEMKFLLAEEKLVTGVIEAAKNLLKEQPPKLDFATGYVAANIAADAKRSDEAVVFYRHLLAARKDRAEMILEELGQHLSEVHRYDEAAAVFGEGAKAPELAEKKPQFLLSQAQALEFAGRTDEAIKTISEARGINQFTREHPLLMLQEAWIFAHSHQHDEAITKYKAIIEKFTQPPLKTFGRRAQFGLSNVYVTQGRLREGEEVLEQVLKESPDDPSVNNDLGYLYADQGKNLEQAEKMIRKAIAAEPDNGAYLDSMGWVLFKLGKYQEALPFLEKAVQNASGGDETLWDHFGDVLEKLNRKDKAVEAWTKALDHSRKQKYPDKKLIERLEQKLKK
jgi:tetratricopeptide (TPR) repeat protein